MSKIEMKIIEIVGGLVGVVLYIIYVFLGFVFGSDLLDMGFISEWLIIGPLLFLIIGSHYIVAGSLIDEKKRKDDEISIKSIMIGFLMWLAVAIGLFIAKSTISVTIFSAAGLIFMVLVYIYLKSKLPESEKFKGFPIMYSIIIALIVFYVF